MSIITIFNLINLLIFWRLSLTTTNIANKMISLYKITKLFKIYIAFQHLYNIRHSQIKMRKKVKKLR